MLRFARAAARSLICTAVLAAALAPPAGADPAPVHRPPVDAPVVDPFRAPEHRYGPGNRGIEYGTAPGTAVTATADGVVVFAGRVAGTRHVTVRHEGDLRTSYSFLDRIDVVVGQRVGQGQVLGTTAGPLHLGARLGDAYFDPATLFRADPVRVHLVPFDVPVGTGLAGERSALGQLVSGVGGLLGGAAGGAAALAQDLAGDAGASFRWLTGSSTQLLRTAAQYLEPLPVRLARRGVAVWQRAGAVADRPCTGAGAEPPVVASRRVAIRVGGLGSSSDGAAIDDVDVAALGYATGDVARFSYAGGRIPGTGSTLGALPESTYQPADTQEDLYASASRLADLVEAVAAAAPGVPLDIYAHSQGGLVTRLALLELEGRHGAGWLEQIGLVALLGTPNGGADLASALHALSSTGAGSTVLDALGAVIGLDADAPSAAQLGEGSEVVERLARSPLPSGVDGLTVGARGDLVVPVPRTYAPGATGVVVPLAGPAAHDELPGSPGTHRELALALAGWPPSCRSTASALVDGLVGEGISLAEDQLGALAWLGGLLLDR